MKAIVLAAGFATRLHPLTRNRAKPLLEVGGRPVLDHVLDRVLAVPEIDDTVVVTNERFHDQFVAWRRGYRDDVCIRVINDGARSDADKRGALGDLALALESLADDGADLLVIGGDNLFDCDLVPFARRFARERHPLLVVRDVGEPVPPGRYSEVTLADDGRVTSFREKPIDPRSSLSAICLYFLPAAIRLRLSQYFADGGDRDAPGHFLQWLQPRQPLFAARLTGRFHDIGNRQTLELARAAFAAKPSGLPTTGATFPRARRNPMNDSRSIGVGIVGAGFIADTRARCYARAGDRTGVVAVASKSPDEARAYSERHGVPRVCTDFEELLTLPEVKLVDLCVPNHLHRPFTEAAAQAGKHVVCTKPLTAYVGQDLPDDAPDEAISGKPRSEMLALAVADAEAMVAAADAHGVQLMYGENWVYAPAIRRARELLAAAGGVSLELRGWESHNGSHSQYSRRWRYNGGGALIRLAAHPIGAMLHLKHAEGIARGTPIHPVAVTCEVADLSRAAAAGATPHVATGWHDVENWGCCVISFSDGTRGVAYGSDNQLGGMESKLEILAANCHLKCNLSPNDMLRAYAPTGDQFGDQYIMEKVSTQAGWNTPMPSEDWSSGHLDMCDDFVTAVADGRPAKADGALGLAVVRVIYAAYVAAAEGRRVTLDP